MATEILATPQKVIINAILDTVTLDLVCGDGYEAQVLFDDIKDRLRDGERLTLSIVRKPQRD